MSTDFLVDVVRDGKVVTGAIAVKPAEELDKPRTIEKLQIERQYWADQGIDWRIVTERDVSPVLTRNLEWLRMLADDH